MQIFVRTNIDKNLPMNSYQQNVSRLCKILYVIFAVLNAIFVALYVVFAVLYVIYVALNVIFVVLSAFWGKTLLFSMVTTSN